MEWDPQRDILVLVGDGGPALARKLLEQGQRRIIVYCGTQLNTIDRFGESWILQGIANTPAVASWPSIDALREPFRGRPCVIVSPGPSLTRNIEQVLSA